MKKIGAITFHASYNFGSNLQAYALQEYIKKIAKEKNEEIEYKIINYRTQVQKDMYDYRKSGSFYKRILNIIFLNRTMKQRQENYENFMKNFLDLTNEYNKKEDLEELNYDYYISGSDQIWNLATDDFDWAYFLDFVSKGKRISYAPSLGPKRREISEESKEKIRELVNKYDNISVREEGSKERLLEIIENKKDVNINVDPTILLDKSEWERIIKQEPILKEDYILFYTLRMTKERAKFLRKLSKKLKMPIVVANQSLKYDYIYGFKRQYQSGPLEFLNLLKNAKLVISSSFHGTVFSILLNKPFYSLDGITDARIKNLLDITNLSERNISINDDLNEKLKDAFYVDFSLSNEKINEERKRSREYLEKALDLGE